MSWSFPLTAPQFWNKLRFANRPEFELAQFKQQSIDGAGNSIGAKFGQPKWRADVVTSNGRHDDDMESQALIKAMLGRDGAFLAYDIRRPNPKADPLGTLISGYTPQVRTVGSDNRSLSLKGLRSNYVLTTGDFLSVSDGSGKRALLQIMEDISASGTTTAEFEVEPFLPSWIAVDQSVDLAHPLGKFKIVAGSYKPQTGAGNRSAGFGFSMMSIP
jgi:hypothetical protein